MVLFLDATQQRHRLGLLRIPVGDLIDEPLALLLRGGEPGDGTLPLVAARQGRRGERWDRAAEGEDALAEPRRVAVLDRGELPQRRRHLRVAGPLGLLAEMDRVLGLGAVEVAEVGEEIAAAVVEAEKARKPAHARLARIGRPCGCQAAGGGRDSLVRHFPLLSRTMARITVEDCLERVGNRFELVLLAARRAKQLLKGARPLVESENKEIVTALREIAAGKVHVHYPQ